MRVLVPVDGSEPSDDALVYALEQFDDAEIVVINVMDPVDSATAWGPGVADDWLSASEERSETILEEAEAIAEDVDRTVETDSVVGRPAHTIVEYADEHDIDHILLGSHGRDGLSRVLLGSVAETVVRRASVPVTVVRSE
jgi:nucleotide-binding universal stress UspA family protein